MYSFFGDCEIKVEVMRFFLCYGGRFGCVFRFSVLVHGGC